MKVSEVKKHFSAIHEGLDRSQTIFTEIVPLFAQYQANINSTNVTAVGQ